MKNIVSILILFFCITKIDAQEFKADISYQYMYAKQWDKAIQTYNFSRPTISNKQPLFMHGANVSLSYIFKSPKHFKHGINLSYTNFTSLASNLNSTNLLLLHFIRLGYMMHYENIEKMKGLYIEAIIAANSSALYRNVNQAAFIYDDTHSKAFNIGAEASLKIGYYLKIKNNFYLSPFVSIAYAPYIYAPNTEAVINQTKSLSNKNWTSISNAQIGIAFHLKK
ncbi:MAG: hypothetical protein WCP57_11045 [Bacteroidota bacterium]